MFFFVIEKARNDARRQAEQNARDQARKDAAEGKSIFKYKFIVFHTNHDVIII